MSATSQILPGGCFGRCNLEGLGDFTLPIDQIKIESAYGPTIVLDHPFQGPSVVSPLLSRLKPKVTLKVGGFTPIVMAPYGDPPPTKWPTLVKAAGVMGGLVLLSSAVGTYYLLHRGK